MQCLARRPELQHLAGNHDMPLRLDLRQRTNHAFQAFGFEL